MIAAIDKLGIREFRMLLLGAGLVITAIAIAALLLPGAKAYRAAGSAVAVLDIVNEDNANLEQQLQERRVKIDDLEFRLNGDMANLPLKQIESYVIGRLQSISWRNKVDLISVEPAAGQQVQTFSEILFNIELIGEYEDIYRWLWDAKNELGFVIVKEYSMRRRDNIDDNPQLLTVISLASYRSQQ
jgi:hypothetical protein